MGERTEGMIKQAQELIEQAYNRGFKAGYEVGFEECDEPNQQLIKKGMDMAWEAASKVIKMGEYSRKFEVFPECGDGEYPYDKVSASEAIERIREYEEKKQNETEEINVGDEVLFNGNTKAFVLRTIMRGLEDRCFIICSDGSGGECDKLRLKKTGRHFPEIAEVLKKMQEGE